tara:strand:+ start:3198 stop:3851 length:654 start_codon:yes stop_codon:yes gene_type:complete
LENSLKDQFYLIQKAIPDRVQLIAVSKKHSFDKIRQIAQYGQKDFGENYPQELIKKAKQAQLEKLNIHFHLIGPLQRNKVKMVLPYVASIQSLHSISLAQEIEKKAQLLNISSVPVWIQLNLNNEESKSGFTEEELQEFIQQIPSFHSLKFQGWMAIPDPSLSLEKSFNQMKTVARHYEGAVPYRFSIGMSHDFMEAIALGSDCIRVGSAIFGSRPV